MYTENIYLNFYIWRELLSLLIKIIYKFINILNQLFNIYIFYKNI
jgi:hypothetical protein